MEIMQAIRSLFSRTASKAVELGTGSFPVVSLPPTNNVTTPEERDAVVARGVLLQQKLKEQLGGNGGA